ncbi:hypothetical protein ACHAWF_007256 [Thalassiosira exigua]
MWAAFKSDLKEFASGAAEETTAVASKVGVNVPVGGVGRGDGGGGGSGGEGGSGAGGGASDALAAATGAAFSMGERGLSGLRVASSMVGGIVAPTAANPPPSSAPHAGGRASPFASEHKPSAALTSMLAAEEDDGEEEEFGGGEKKVPSADDFFEEQLGEATNGAKAESQSQAAAVEKSAPKSDAIASQSAEDAEVMKVLQSKLDAVEKSCAELQAEHRRRTAELVELRAKVEDIGGEKDLAPTGRADEEVEVKALQEEIEQLKLEFDEKIKGMSGEHEEVVAVLVREEGALEEELTVQGERNDALTKANETLQASGDGEELLRQHRRQVEELTSELNSLQAKYDETATELDRAEERSSQERREQLARTSELERSLAEAEGSLAAAMKEAEDSKARLAAVEAELQAAKKEAREADVAAPATPDEAIVDGPESGAPAARRDAENEVPNETSSGAEGEEVAKEEEKAAKKLADSDEELSGATRTGRAGGPCLYNTSSGRVDS